MKQTKRQKINRGKLLFFLLIPFLLNLLSTFNSHAQDIHFSQFNNSPLTLNPSLAGSFDGDLRVIANFKDQWASISPYMTFALSGDMGFFKSRRNSSYLGAGISFFSDRAGTTQLSLNQFNFSLSYHVSLNENNMLSTGLQGGLGLRSINLNNNIKWDNQYNGTNYDPNIPSDEPLHSGSISYPDFAAGMQWSYGRRERNAISGNNLKMDAGIAAYHLTTPNQSFYGNSTDKLPMRFVVHGGIYAGIINSKTSLAPSFEYMRQDRQKEFVIGLMLVNKMLQQSLYTRNEKSAYMSFGAYYRFGDAIIPTFEIQKSDYAFGISYDVNVSKLSTVTTCRGGFEFTLRMINSNIFKKR